MKIYKLRNNTATYLNDDQKKKYMPTDSDYHHWIYYLMESEREFSKDLYTEVKGEELLKIASTIVNDITNLEYMKLIGNK